MEMDVLLRSSSPPSIFSRLVLQLSVLNIFSSNVVVPVSCQTQRRDERQQGHAKLQAKPAQVLEDPTRVTIQPLEGTTHCVWSSGTNFYLYDRFFVHWDIPHSHSYGWVAPINCSQSESSCSQQTTVERALVGEHVSKSANRVGDATLDDTTRQISFGPVPVISDPTQAFFSSIDWTLHGYQSQPLPQFAPNLEVGFATLLDPEIELDLGAEENDGINWRTIRFSDEALALQNTKEEEKSTKSSTSTTPATNDGDGAALDGPEQALAAVDNEHLYPHEDASETTSPGNQVPSSAAAALAGTSVLSTEDFSPAAAKSWLKRTLGSYFPSWWSSSMNQNREIPSSRPNVDGHWNDQSFHQLPDNEGENAFPFLHLLANHERDEQQHDSARSSHDFSGTKQTAASPPTLLSDPPSMNNRLLWRARSLIGTRITTAEHTSCCIQHMTETKSRSGDTVFTAVVAPGTSRPLMPHHDLQGFVLTEYCVKVEEPADKDDEKAKWDESPLTSRVKLKDVVKIPWYVNKTRAEISAGIKRRCIEEQDLLDLKNRDFLRRIVPTNATAWEYWRKQLAKQDKDVERARLEERPQAHGQGDGPSARGTSMPSSRSARATFAEPWIEAYPQGYVDVNVGDDVNLKSPVEQEENGMKKTMGEELQRQVRQVKDNEHDAAPSNLHLLIPSESTQRAEEPFRGEESDVDHAEGEVELLYS
ncbi:unnamed protein product [Amoebophrya sp. A120]|nr:unnamed protein product [Amoebophrya sp. A120]|eukprot:GSA120T00000098001.1